MARIGDLLASLLRRRTPDGDPLPDAVLLDRFARTRDPAAFELLVWRHGPMVLAACRRMLRDGHTAEDAFQAAFLVLARKAGSVRGSAAGWLHRVALRVCLRMKRRLPPTPTDADPISPPDPDTVEAAERSAILDEEVARLPEWLRVPVVVCYLQGHTTERAAEVLGIPRGTVLSRLATARKRLAVRLTVRGVAPLVAAVAVPELSADTGRVATEAAVGFALGSVPKTVSTQLAREVLSMTTRRTILAAVVGGLAAVGTGVAVWAGDEKPTPKPADGTPKPVAEKAKPADEPEVLTAEDVLKRQAKLRDDKPVQVVCKVQSVAFHTPSLGPILVSDAKLPNRDYYGVVLGKQAVADLKRLGITDLGKHFNEKNVTVKGKLTSVLYTGFPAFAMVYILVESLEQIRAVEE